MRAGGLADDVDAIRISAEPDGIAMDPRNGTPHLVHHGEQGAADVLHGGKIHDHEMRARTHEHLGAVSVLLGRSALPRPAVNEYDEGGAVAGRSIDIELLDVARAVGLPLRRAQPLAREPARRGQTAIHLVAVGRIHCLIVGVVEFLLIVIEENARALDARGHFRGRVCGWLGDTHGLSR
jgi:hypothetical protein